MQRASIIGVMVAFVLSACVGRTEVITSGTDRAVGADGYVEIDSEEGGNYLVSVTTSNLPPPARLGAGLTLYVVWFQAPEQQPMRVGTLNYDENRRTGAMRATTALPTFTVLVSAEAAAEVVAPSDHIVFRNTVDSPEG